jgi:hypothetical protein
MGISTAAIGNFVNIASAKIMMIHWIRMAFALFVRGHVSVQGVPGTK